MMADNLEKAVTGQGQYGSTRSHSSLKERQHSQASGSKKSISQLRREIMALRSDTERKPENVGMNTGHAQELVARIRVLESKVIRYESKLSKKEETVNNLKDEVASLMKKLTETTQELRDTRAERERLRQRAVDSQEEFETLKASIDRDASKFRRLQEEVDEGQILVEQTESRACKAEELYANEKSRRLELEQRLVDKDDMVQSLQVKLDTLKKRMNADQDAYQSEFDALHREVAKAKSEALDSKKYATQKAEQLIQVVQERDDVRDEVVKLGYTLKETRAELESYIHRARVAEETAAQATAELLTARARNKNDESSTSYEKNSMEIELKALKEVLKSVTASAQAKDENLVILHQQHEHEKSLWQQKQQEYDEKIKGLEDKMTHLESVRNELESRQSEMVEKVRKNLSDEIDKERKEHMDALRELESSHAAQIEATIEEYMTQTKATDDSMMQRLEQTESLLLNKQDEIDEMTRDYDHMRHLYDQMKVENVKVAREKDELKQKLEKTKVELLQAQDEVEALLTARLEQELSRGNAASKPVLAEENEKWLFHESQAENMTEKPRALPDETRGDMGPPDQPQAGKSSPMKKFADFVRRKTKSPQKRLPI
jgi:myosin protein heavy chain